MDVIFKTFYYLWDLSKEINNICAIYEGIQRCLRYSTKLKFTAFYSYVIIWIKEVNVSLLHFLLVVNTLLWNIEWVYSKFRVLSFRGCYWWCSNGEILMKSRINQHSDLKLRNPAHYYKSATSPIVTYLLRNSFEYFLRDFFLSCQRNFFLKFVRIFLHYSSRDFFRSTSLRISNAISCMCAEVYF